MKSAYSIKRIETEGVQQVQGAPSHDKRYLIVKEEGAIFESLQKIGSEIFFDKKEALAAANKKLDALIKNAEKRKQRLIKLLKELG